MLAELTPPSLFNETENLILLLIILRLVPVNRLASVAYHVSMDQWKVGRFGTFWIQILFRILELLAILPS